MLLCFLSVLVTIAILVVADYLDAENGLIVASEKKRIKAKAKRSTTDKVPGQGSGIKGVDALVGTEDTEDDDQSCCCLRSYHLDRFLKVAFPSLACMFAISVAIMTVCEICRNCVPLLVPTALARVSWES